MGGLDPGFEILHGVHQLQRVSRSFRRLLYRMSTEVGRERLTDLVESESDGGDGVDVVPQDPVLDKVQSVLFFVLA